MTEKEMNPIANVEEDSKLTTRMNEEQRRILLKYALSLYLKGIKGSKAAELIKLKAPNELGDSQAYKIYHYAKQEYLSQLPQSNSEIAKKEAIQELEGLEDEIRDKVTRENAEKYKVILETKKQKHSIVGLGKDAAMIEISITSDLDSEFLRAQNAKIIDEPVIVDEVQESNESQPEN